MTRFRKIYNWNMSRGLIEKGFNLKSEVAMLKEELDELQYSEPKKWYNFFNVGRKESSEEDKIDALNDLIVVATGGIYKLNYDADKTMDETIKEVSSRRGVINLATGKWTKMTDDESKKLWYTARYDRCKM